MSERNVILKRVYMYDTKKRNFSVRGRYWSQCRVFPKNNKVDAVVAQPVNLVDLNKQIEVPPSSFVESPLVQYENILSPVLSSTLLRLQHFNYHRTPTQDQSSPSSIQSFTPSQLSYGTLTSARYIQSSESSSSTMLSNDTPYINTNVVKSTDQSSNVAPDDVNSRNLPIMIVNELPELVSERLLKLEANLTKNFKWVESYELSTKKIRRQSNELYDRIIKKNTVTLEDPAIVTTSPVQQLTFSPIDLEDELT